MMKFEKKLEVGEVDGTGNGIDELVWRIKEGRY